MTASASGMPASVPGRLAGRVCAVTGATGIAAAAARRLASEGATLHVVSIVEEDARALSGEVGGTWAVADLTDEEQAEAAFASLERLDALAAIVGGSGRPFGDGLLHDVSLAAWEATLRLNLTTAFLASREGLRIMRRGGHGGSIVLTASVAAFDAVPDMTGSHTYSAAKAGVIGLGHAIATTYAPEGIRANVIAPSLVATPMSRRAASDPATVAFAERKQPLAGGFLDPADIAAAAAWLCSDDSRQVTGQVIAVDGGWTVSDGR
jgi:NAD(P)-dependent dehydrogenase (short-subunit alcohol dehydrogenase family)